MSTNTSHKPWYEILFENYGKTYEQNDFTKGTLGEVDFIEKELNFKHSLTILDIGCGTGRHAIELARRGFSVTGIDLSDSMLTQARENAIHVNVRVSFLKMDARALRFKNEFDAVLMLCEGGFPLMETDEMNYAILQSAANALRSGGKFIFTTLNGLFPLFHSVKDFLNAESSASKSGDNTFDLMTFRDRSRYTSCDDEGKQIVLDCDERYYVPSEITWLLKSLKFTRIDILGCEIGNWKRDSSLTTDHYEMLVVAVKA
jgi:2-polyprenyl-3-methyl-5-hydroxy-6-metoxy-1,4-benzoquinol methylase